ncbi:MAG: MBL fold metallo-hydrolase [Thermoanaerobaculia bacterium]
MDDSPSPDLLYAPHGEPGRFFNPWAPFNNSLAMVLRWQLGKKEYDKSGPIHVPVVANDGAYLKDRGQRDSVTWIGHSSFAVQDGGEVFLADPHFGKRALVPPRVSPPGIPIGAVPGDAFAVLSHNHYDHLDDWTVRHLPETIQWFVPLGLGAWFQKRGRRVVEMDWWRSVRHGKWTLTFLPAQHWSNRFGMARNSTLWGSWLLESGTRRYYFAGDSGYFHGFKEIGARYPGIDVAFLPIGAYEPRWFMRSQHVDPEEGYQAFLDLGARYMCPMHWGCFDLTDEPTDLAPRVLDQILEERKAGRERVRTLAVGERWFPE